LWYTALQIGSNIAKYVNEDEISKDWYEKSQFLKTNFIKLFFDDEKNLIADCLKSENKRDFSLRPNLFFKLPNSTKGVLPTKSVNDLNTRDINKHLYNILTFN
jgi:GH15 family glucan-1,4-alpha-glucosidase